MRSERGATAVLVAGAMFFLFGAAALAVDVSMFYGSARTDQTTADLSCLAGVIESADADKITMAAEFARQNWPTMQGAAVSISGQIGVMTAAANQVTFETNVGGDPARMRVRVLESADTHFAQVLGESSVTVVQEAFCEALKSTGGPGALPLGALTGPFSGDLFDCAAKVTGNCGAIRLDGNGANDFEDAIANGAQQEIVKHHGNQNTPDTATGLAVTGCPTGGPCNLPATETGNMVGKFNSGLTTRLSNVAGADCVIGTDFNCDSMSQVLGGAANTLFYSFGGSAPTPFPSEHFLIPGWQPSLYGAYSSVMNQQYYYDGPGIKCDSPRLGTIPIVVNAKANNQGGNINWTLGNAPTTWPTGNGNVKIVGFYTVYLREPLQPGTGPGNNNYDKVEADVIWFGPNAKCKNGTPFSPLGSAAFNSGVKLVANN